MTRLFTLLLCTWLGSLTAQVNVQVNVTAADIATTCTDIFSDPDPLWSISINGNDALVVDDGTCFNTLPLLVLDSTTFCLNEIPTQVEICFRVWENDASPIAPPCSVDESCLEEICQLFPVAPGTIAYNLPLPPGGASSGNIDFTISGSGSPTSLNDDICDAIDLGTMQFGQTLGDASIIQYENLCGNNANGTEEDPFDQGGAWENEAGVWYTFTTGAEVGSLVFLNGQSDLDEPIDLEIAVYESDNGTCGGNLTLVREVRDGGSNNTAVDMKCQLLPNTTYFVLVDGNEFGPLRGRFGLEVEDVGFREAGNLRCEAVDLGTVPLDGSVQTQTSYTNYCSDNSDDPFTPAFSSQRSVWFKFQPSATGHVYIEGISSPLDDIGIQFALYRSTNNTCTGFFIHLESAYSSQELNEYLTEQCLDPERTYWLLIDGDGGATTGAMDIIVNDNGDITPRAELNETICAGDVFEVGNSDYITSGSYSDTLTIPGSNCDSIVNLELTVLDPIVVDAFTSFPATGIGNLDGEGTASATGGTGNYTYQWSSGQTGAVVTGLEGDANVCVTVTDDKGCTGEFCFVVEFVEGIVPIFTVDTVDCNGGTDGAFTLDAIGGLPPYDYTWENTDLDIVGSGGFDGPGDVENITNLAAGLYSVTISDAVFDTIFIINVPQPDPLQIQLVDQIDAQCFQDCNGALEVTATGGNGGYQYLWTGQPQSNILGNLCAGNYVLTVTDAKGCSTTATYTIAEPDEFIATATEQQSVRCFDGNDGIATVNTNGTPQSYLWETGDTTATVSELPAGFYLVTVTDVNGCVSTSEATVTEPDAPLEIQIVETSGILCGGDANGVLGVDISGPGTNFTYQWANGTTAANNANLNAGSYALTVTNENGCVATAEYELEGPAPLAYQLATRDITCLDAENDGAILLDTITGGVGPYTVRLDERGFGAVTEIPGLTEGAYELEIEDANGCITGEQVTIFGPPEVLLELSGPPEIQLGETAEITTQSSSTNVVYDWTASEPFAFEDSLFRDGIVARPVEEFFVQVTATDTVNFCTATADFRVVVNTERRVFLPNAFSPNDDGQNDRFGPSVGNDVEQILNFRVFNRYGALVFAQQNVPLNDPSSGWDGSFRGQRLDPDVFVWQAEVKFIDGRTEMLFGDVALMR